MNQTEKIHTQYKGEVAHLNASKLTEHYKNSPPASLFVTQIGPSDVLICTRGTPAIVNPGNIRFRRFAQDLKDTFRRAKGHMAKDLVVKELLEAVRQQGGKFLRKFASLFEAEKLGVQSSSGTNVWVIETDESLLMKKARQLLRDRNTRDANCSSASSLRRFHKPSRNQGSVSSLTILLNGKGGHNVLSVSPEGTKNCRPSSCGAVLHEAQRILANPPEHFWQRLTPVPEPNRSINNPSTAATFKFTSPSTIAVAAKRATKCVPSATTSDCCAFAGQVDDSTEDSLCTASTSKSTGSQVPPHVNHLSTSSNRNHQTDSPPTAGCYGTSTDDIAAMDGINVFVPHASDAVVVNLPVAKGSTKPGASVEQDDSETATSSTNQITWVNTSATVTGTKILQLEACTGTSPTVASYVTSMVQNMLLLDVILRVPTATVTDRIALGRLLQCSPPANTPSPANTPTTSRNPIENPLVHAPNTSGHTALLIGKQRSDCDLSPFRCVCVSTMEAKLLWILCSHGLPIASLDRKTPDGLGLSWKDIGLFLFPDTTFGGGDDKYTHQLAQGLAMDPIKLTSKVVSLLEKLCNRSALGPPRTESSQEQSVLTPFDGNLDAIEKRQIVSNLEDILFGWAAAVGQIDFRTRRPISFSTEDLAFESSSKERHPLIETFAVLDPLACKAIVEQIAFLTQLRSMVLKNVAERMSSNSTLSGVFCCQAADTALSEYLKQASVELASSGLQPISTELAVPLVRTVLSKGYEATAVLISLSPSKIQESIEDVTRCLHHHTLLKMSQNKLS